MSFIADDWGAAPELHSPAPAETVADDVTRALPHAPGPEKSLLSSMLQEPREWIGIAVEEGLTAAHFYLPAHSVLFGFLLELFEADVEIEIVSLVQKLLDRGKLDSVGGPSAVAGLLTYAPSPGHFRHHLRMVREKHILRTIIQNSNEAIAQAYDAPDEVAELLDRTEAAFLSIREGASAVRERTKREVIDEILGDFQKEIDGNAETAGISTGYDGLEQLGARLKPGEMFVIAARPSMGKTALMMNIVENVAFATGRPVQVFSAEMTYKAVMQRLLFGRARYARNLLSRGQKPNKGDLQRIQRAALDIVASKIHVDDSSGITINEIRAKARRKHREEPLALIAIDYLQLLRSTSKQAANSREREVAEISSGVKNLAKELGVPIVLLAQLNRGPEGRTGKNLGKPRMSDLRESGSIEQDADMLGLLYREAYYAEGEEEKEASAGRTELILAKNRNGPTGHVPLTFIADLMRFEDGAPEAEPEMWGGAQPSRFGDDD